MTITSTLYTTNSYKITVTSETSSSGMLAAIDTAITNFGWTQYDVITTTTYSPIVTYVYRVLNADTTTYKYFILRCDTIKNAIYTSCCESWNNSTHVGTNESWTGGGVFPQYYDVKDSFIFAAGSDKHLIIWPFIRNEPGMWSGVFEFERLAGEDTAALATPCFAWTNSLMLGTPWGRTQTTGFVSSKVMFAFPRTADGFTGSNAAQIYSPTTSRGMWPPLNYTSGTLTYTDPNILHLGSFYNQSYAWDTSRTPVSAIGVDAQTKVMPFGRAYNVGVVKALGTYLDTTYINVDSTGGWPDAAGSNTECILLPLNGGMEANTTTGAQLQISYASLGTSVASKVIGIGSSAWAACSDGVRVWNMDSGNNTSTTQFLAGQVVTDILYDGADYIYAAGATSVYKIQVSNTANIVNTASGAISNGAAYLGMDNSYVYASGRTANVNPIIYIIPKGTISSGVTQANSTVATVIATGWGTPVPDYNGLVYVATQPANIGATQTFRLASFTASTALQSQNAVNPIRPTAAAGGGVNSNFWIDPITSVIYLIASDSTVSAGNFYTLNTSLVNSTALGVMGTNATQANYASGLAYSTITAAAAGDLRGDLVVQPIRGMLHIQPKRASGNTTATWSNRIHLISPQSNGTPERAYTNTAGNIITDFASAPNGVLTHNGPRTFFSDSNTVSNNTIGYVRNYYSLNGINGAVTARILIKG